MVVKYVPVMWPESQKYQQFDDFDEHAYLINCDNNQWGDNAYFIDEEWMASKLHKIRGIKESELFDIITFETGVKLADLIGKNRERRFVKAREMFAHFAFKKGYTVTEIANMLDRHYSSVVNLLNQYSNDVVNDRYAFAVLAKRIDFVLKRTENNKTGNNENNN